MDTETIGIIGMLLITLGLLYLIMRMRSKNIEVTSVQNQPIIAGEDELSRDALQIKDLKTGQSTEHLIANAATELAAIIKKADSH